MFSLFIGKYLKISRRHILTNMLLKGMGVNALANFIKGPVFQKMTIFENSY